MEIFILQYSDLDNGTDDLELFLKEEEPLDKAIKGIKNYIDNEFDMDDVHHARCAERVDECFADGDLYGAIAAFNEFQNQYMDYPVYWHVHQRTLQGYDSISGANKNGATCRKCKVFNEYANADKSDGTYLCHQCKNP